MKVPTFPAAMVLVTGVLLAFIFGACVHTPAGTSVEIALARKPEVYRLPAPPKPAHAVATVQRMKTAKKSKPAPPPIGDHELAARAYGRGESSMKAGHDAEAIAAFEETVRIDPRFRDAWQKLAILYDRTGQEKKAIEAFRKAKQVGGG